MSGFDSIRIPAMKNLWCMLNFCLFAETDVDKRAFLYVELGLHLGGLLMLPENITAIVARNERWTGEAASEPYEAGWAREAVIFVRALQGAGGRPAGGAGRDLARRDALAARKAPRLRMPAQKDGIAVASRDAFRQLAARRRRFSDGAECTVLATIHLKA